MAHKFIKNSSHINSLLNDGFTILRNLHSHNKIAEIESLLNKYFDPQKNWEGVPSRDVKDKRIYNLASKDFKFIEFITNKTILDILKPGLQDPYYRWIDDDYCNFILNSFSARSSGNFLDLHIDSGIPFRGSHALGYVVINAIEKTSSKNGATFLIPKTHQSGTFTDRSRKDWIFAELNPGDALIIDSRLWHGAGDNILNSSRWTINAHFSRWFIKQDIDIPNTISQEIFNQCNIQQKIILGFLSQSSPNENVRINIKCGLDHLDKINCN